MNAMRKSSQGAALIEMTLVGIPIIFVLISIFEISRGMWIYQTMAHAVREGVRFATVHGYNCVNDPPTITNNCGKTVADVAQVIQSNGVGLIPAATNLAFTAPYPGGTTTTCTMSACPGTIWPPTGGGNTIGTVIRIDISTPFNSALGMFWPGAGKVTFTTVNLGASSMDMIQY